MAAPPKSQREICLFCPCEANSPEHLFSNWLQCLFPHGYKPRYTSATAAYRRTETEEFDQEVSKTRRLHKRAVNTIKHFVVCDHCNTGWMSRMENRTKPILVPLITGQKVTLNRRQLKILARWIAKTIIVNEAGFEKGAVIPAGHRQIIRRNGRLPNDWQIYLGQSAESGGLGITYNTATFVLPPSSNAKGLPGYANCTVILMGALVIFVFVSNGPFERNNGSDIVLLRTVAPVTQNLDWPPEKQLSDRHVLLLTEALSRAIDGPGMPFTDV